MLTVRYIIPCRDLSCIYLLYVYGCSRMGLILYIPCVGFQRCPSRRLGQCEGLDMWDGQRRIPRFIFVEVQHFFLIIVGDWGSIRS